MEDIVEQTVDSTVDMVTGRTFQPKLGHLAIVSTVACIAGGGIAWLVAKRHYQAKYEALAEREIAEAKAFYNNLSKRQLIAEESDEENLTEAGARAAEALVSYQTGVVSAPEDGTLMVKEERVEIETTPVTRNVFEDQDLIPEDDRWDQDREEAYRASIGEGEPYIICDKEYLENENEYEQKTLTYYAEDDVLIDDSDKPIEMIDLVVGEENLTHFGKGTMDNRVVLIRNDKLAMDFEITKREGSYAKEVLGFQHSDEPKVRKMRRDIE